MTDRREQILSRVFTILQATPNIGPNPNDPNGGLCVFRNRDQLPDEMRPSVCLLDGSEEADQRLKPQNQAPGRTPTLMTLKPMIIVSLKVAKPTNTYTDADGNPVNIGTVLNGYRYDIVKAISNDATLQTLCRVGQGGEIFLSAVDTDQMRGQPMTGELAIAYWLTYPLIPSQL